MAMMGLMRVRALPALVAPALVLALSVKAPGIAVAPAERPLEAVGDASAPVGECVDATAVLIHTGDGVFRCEGGVPVARPRPWNAGGCGDGRWAVPGASRDPQSFVVGPPDACLVGAGVRLVHAGGPGR
jgi:hypothetical protein